MQTQVAVLSLAVLVLSAGPKAKVLADYADASHEGLAPTKGGGPTVKASSELCEGKGDKRRCFTAAQVLDDDDATAWCEGAAGEGEGQSLTFTFPQKVRLAGVSLVPYYAKDAKTARHNARVAKLELKLDGVKHLVALPDVAAEERCVRGPCGDETCDEKQGGDEVCFEAEQRLAEGEGWLVRFPRAETKTVTLTVRGVHSGEKFEDLCISWVEFFVPE